MTETADTATTVDPREVERFAALAAEWWNPRGKMGVLHKFNPVRLAYLREKIVTHFNRDPRAMRPLEGLRLLDIGCGGGLLCEPLARMGATVVGIDPAERNVRVASLHAGESGAPVEYRATTAEAMAAAGERFDVVLAMEVVEHVADVGLFVNSAAEMVKPGGLMCAATLNRTGRSFALAIVGAEYVLGWLPRGTHDWKRFVTPEELAAAMTAGGLAVTDREGVVFNPLLAEWRRSTDLAVNYMLLAERPA
ncbi:bifunctional 2-polyprenyl-6-hydroxyphenol methylase/3-demethylubiquinol 3-O-methyltransferase UbiG [Ancylobacter defluvii]|uniref:Ubiquinone biosynthesis O-methyltransferase n=1 Tax=Ancylobacter defluvii TaxID=1282440 RepID=A0A9W6N903_9HYPH|nr:bifunctional 2-polyprenyl-6-hydroxyphenol methylase/3-demethylubiquinol 3-O-methyltransferase UbiG [Ancylobacter defluvii]MBS7587270.1 bifunctional 2-polyprenyl-6-hydroxyphenol methylase/3-demethylubiquinol 3-O-methyltransferase UbiG [Ancylobacter defluvii]GLK81957.1 ubiquinone biosynthesis O-methyltransferase [Ancylobacter defluvii]